MNKSRLPLLLSALALGMLTGATGLHTAAYAQSATAAVEKQSTDYSNILPADETAAVVVIQNIFKPAAFDEKSPVARLLAHPAVKHHMVDLLSKVMSQAAELRDTLELGERDLPRLFTGKAVFAVILSKKDAAPAKITSEGSADGDGAKAKVHVEAGIDAEPEAIVEFKGSSAEYEALTDKFDARLKSRDAKTDISRERADGLLIHAYESDAALLGGESGTRVRLFHAMRDGTMVITRDRSRLLDTFRALARGAAENPLSGRSDFIAVKKEMGANDGFCLVNLAALMPAANDMLRRSLEAQAGENPQMKLMVDPDTVVRALGLENFSSLYGSLKIDEQRLEIRYGLTWKDRAGAASLINFGPEAVKIPEYASAEYKGLDVTTVDFPATLDAGIALFKAASPGAYGMAGILLASKPETQQLMDTLRKGVIDNLKPDLVSLLGYASAHPAPDEEPGKIWVISLRDPSAAQAAIDAIYAMDKAADGKPGLQPETREYLGVKIHRLPKLPLPVSAIVAEEEDEPVGPSEITPAMLTISYAFIGDRLVVSTGPDSLVESVVANMKNPGKSLPDERFTDALADLPGTPCSVGYGDVATYLKAAITETLRSGKHRKAGIADAELAKARSAAADLNYFWASKAYYDKSGLYGRLVVAEGRNEAGK